MRAQTGLPTPRDEADRRRSPTRHGSQELGSRCGSCACDPELLDPWLLAQWLRSLPDRYAELFNQAPPERDIMRAHPWPGAWSASQYVFHVAKLAQSAADDVLRVMADRAPGTVTVEAAATCRTRPLPKTVLAALALSIERLTATAELIAADDWLIGIRHHEELLALELIRQALHEANHHLVEARQVLEEVQLHPAEAGAAGVVGIPFSATLSDGGGPEPTTLGPLNTTTELPKVPKLALVTSGARNVSGGAESMSAFLSMVEQDRRIVGLGS